METSLRVNLGERSYDIHFGAGLSARLRADLQAARAAGRKVALVTDANLAAHQASWLDAITVADGAGGASGASGAPGAGVGGGAAGAVGSMGTTGAIPRLVLPAGEGTKCLRELGRVWDFLAANRIDRSSLLVAVGGGVIGDLAGFAAASYLRGIPFIQVPTTLLAMVDSSVGGKTGINLEAGKNLAGAFYQPQAVYVDTALLATLSSREFAAGMAEVIKYALLGDAELLARLERAPLTVSSEDLGAVVRRCCAIKARVVEADERETAAEGGRALLNLGHTFGHAIEQVTGYGAYLHGEAVAVGLAAAARLSHKLGYLGALDVARVESVVAAHMLPVRLHAPLPLPALTAAMARDKKVRAGGLRFVVLRALGEAATQGGVDPALADAAFREVGATAAPAGGAE